MARRLATLMKNPSRLSTDIRDGITHNSCAEEVNAMPDQYDDPTPQQTDKFMNTNVFLPRGEGYQRATIIHRKRNSSRNKIGRRSANPFLDTRVYEDLFPDCEGVSILSNTATTSLFDNCSYYGHNLMLFRSLLAHNSDVTEVQRYYAFVNTQWFQLREGKDHQGVATAC